MAEAEGRRRTGFMAVCKVCLAGGGERFGAWRRGGGAFESPFSMGGFGKGAFVINWQPEDQSWLRNWAAKLPKQQTV